MRKRILGWIGVLGLAIPLAWVGRAAVMGKREKAPADVVQVACRDFSAVVKATGVVRPAVGAEVRLGSQLSGVVKRLYVHLGDSVEQGQPLAELDTSGLEARRAQAAAALVSAETNLAYTRSDLGRQRKLAEAGAISPGALDVSERAYALARAAILENKANLAYATSELGRARIVSPISGVVSSVALQQGETVAVGAAVPVFLTIIDFERLEVWAYVDETDIGRIQSGQGVRFTVDAYPNHEFSGEIVAVHPKAEIRDNVVNYVAVVRIHGPWAKTLRPEMTAALQIVVNRRRAVLSVPRRAVGQAHGEHFVFKVVGATTERRRISVGIRDESHWEIVRGLEEGDRVLGDPRSSSPQERSHES